jgi:hypothetical protein
MSATIVDFTMDEYRAFKLAKKLMQLQMRGDRVSRGVHILAPFIQQSLVVLSVMKQRVNPALAEQWDQSCPRLMAELNKVHVSPQTAAASVIPDATAANMSAELVRLKKHVWAATSVMLVCSEHRKSECSKGSECMYCY